MRTPGMAPTAGMALLTLAAAYVATVFTYAGAAGPNDCAPLPRAAWISESLARAGAEHLGYRVERIGADHGCYLVRATDAGGAAVELRLDPLSGDLVRRPESRAP